jgi:hypothetical protein
MRQGLRSHRTCAKRCMRIKARPAAVLTLATAQVGMARSRNSHATRRRMIKGATQRLGTGRIYLIAALAAVLSGGLLLAARAEALTAPPTNGASDEVDITERALSAASGVEITNTGGPSGQDSTVVYSVHLDTPGVAKRIRVAAEVYVSNCWGSDINPSPTGPRAGDNTPCKSISAYGYAPDIRVRLYEADDATDRAHDPGTRVLAFKDDSCPHDRHHCPIVLRYGESDPPISGNHDQLNVEIMAWHSGADGDDVLELEADCAGGKLNPCTPESTYPTKGQLGVTRLGGQYAATAPIVDLPGNAAMPLVPIDDGSPGYKPKVVYSIEVPDLDAGDILQTEARISLRDSNYPNTAYKFTHVIALWWVLSSSDTAINPASGANTQYIGPTSGENCEHDGDGCALRQIGTWAAPNPYRLPAQPMYLNLVAEARDEAAPNGTNEFVKVLATPAPWFERLCTPEVAVAPGGPSPCGW